MTDEPGEVFENDPDEPAGMGWWAQSGEQLLAMLNEVKAGADPDMVYAEAYANSDHEDVAATPAQPPVPGHKDEIIEYVAAMFPKLAAEDIVTSAIVIIGYVNLDKRDPDNPADSGEYHAYRTDDESLLSFHIYTLASTQFDLLTWGNSDTLDRESDDDD